VSTATPIEVSGGIAATGSLRAAQIRTIVLLFTGYAACYYCRADLSVAAPLVADELGRHGISHNIFIYHRDPDDQMIEFYTEMDQMLDEELGYFDPRPWHRDRPQRPKVWDRQSAALIWGPPQGPDHARQRNME